MNEIQRTRQVDLAAAEEAGMSASKYLPEHA